jgi:cytochrome d ubiquinol oxidase subunit II
MELFWYIILAIMLVTYVILDGYDFGAGIVHLLFAKNEKDKKAILKSIGPFWDANEVWLIAAGGVLFFAFPKLYASAFSGFYLPLILVLWMLIFRAIGLEFRGQVNSNLWKTFWDKAFGLSSLFLALFFGTALGNVIRGVNLGGVTNGESLYEPLYFFLPLWNPEFSPTSEHQGVIDWFTILIGIIAVVALTIHGGNWIILKTNVSIHTKIKSLNQKLSVLLLILIIASLAVWKVVDPNPFHNFVNYPVLWIFPSLALLGNLGLLYIKKMKKDYSAFLFSSLFLAGALISSGISIFPKLLPSTNQINPSLTIYNVSADFYGLKVGSYWYVIAIVLVIIYIIVQYRIFKGKLDDVDYGEH